MSKCIKTKNPCKICLAPVSQKNGLQCQGACRTWIHYKCLNYTAGKVKDIKDGTITVTCPCPDCKTATLPKEYRTDEPYSCTNLKCPAYLPPMCEHTNCPSSTVPPHKANQTSACKMPPIRRCGEDCKDYAIPSHAPNVCQIQTHSSMFVDPTMSPAYSNQSSGVGDILPTSTVEQLCNTVGQLTNQINQLMCKMKEACNTAGRVGGGGHKGGSGGHKVEKGGQKGGGGGTCGHKGPKALCPKPCFCPGNPGPGPR